jgi:hypothetical protein
MGLLLLAHLVWLMRRRGGGHCRGHVGAEKVVVRLLLHLLLLLVQSGLLIGSPGGNQFLQTVLPVTVGANQSEVFFLVQ